MQIVAAKEQTAFRFDKNLLASMKMRAKSLGRSLNSYVSDLIIQDLKESMTLPKVSSPDRLDEEIASFSGIMPLPSEDDLKSDARLSAIWSR